MKILSIKEIITFKNKTDRSKKTFIANIKSGKEKLETEGKSGGDYWISCLSAIANCYRINKSELITHKIEELRDKYEGTEKKQTQDMYKRNMDILSKYERFDFNKWIPAKDTKFIKKHRVDEVLTIRGLEIKVSPNHVFVFQGKEGDEIGAIWFVAKLKGFKKEELGMFTEALYRYLKTVFSKKYTINPKYCISVDVVNNYDVNYLQFEKGEVLPLLSSTLNDIKKLL